MQLTPKQIKDIIKLFIQEENLQKEIEKAKDVEKLLQNDKAQVDEKDKAEKISN